MGNNTVAMFLNVTRPHTTDVETARQGLAARYPEHLWDKSRTYRCIPRDAILRGDWDGGDLMRETLAQLTPA